MICFAFIEKVLQEVILLTQNNLKDLLKVDKTSSEKKNETNN